MQTEIQIGERMDVVNEHLSLIQRTDMLPFGTDALLLAAFIPPLPRASAIELGAGSGIISLLLAARNKVKSAELVEVQPVLAELCTRNIRLNGFDDRLRAVCADLRDYPAYGTQDGVELVYANPPYMRTDSGALSDSSLLQAARHEEHGTIRDFCAAAAKKLRFGGRFCLVYRPERMAELFSALRDARLEPKRMTFVSATPARSPSMLLLEARFGGREGLRVTRPLYTGAAACERADHPDISYIMDHGSFPEDMT